jgi:hypothetical protein
MKAILDIGVVAVIVLMMGAVGMELEGRHHRAVLRRKGMLPLTLAAQAVILPALGFGLTRALAPGRAIAGAGIRGHIGAADGLGPIGRQQGRKPGLRANALHPPNKEEGQCDAWC